MNVFFQLFSSFHFYTKFLEIDEKNNLYNLQKNETPRQLKSDQLTLKTSLHSMSTNHPPKTSDLESPEKQDSCFPASLFPPIRIRESTSFTEGFVNFYKDKENLNESSTEEIQHGSHSNSQSKNEKTDRDRDRDRDRNERKRSTGKIIQNIQDKVQEFNVSVPNPINNLAKNIKDKKENLNLNLKNFSDNCHLPNKETLSKAIANHGLHLPSLSLNFSQSNLMLSSSFAKPILIDSYFIFFRAA